MSILKCRVITIKSDQILAAARVMFFRIFNLRYEPSLALPIVIRITLVLIVAAVSSEAIAAPRPVYLFSHRANDIDDISESIDNGGNAIEIDLQFCGSRGWKVNHNHCRGSVTLENWLLSYSANTNKRQIAALNFDIKADPSEASADDMRDLVSMARASLGNDLLIIYSVGAWENRELLEHIMLSLKENEAVNIDASSGRTAQQKIDFFKSNGVNNAFYADGSSGRIVRSAWANIRLARDNREAQRDVKMVYSWTFMKKRSIRKMLIQERLDGLLVNDPSIYSVRRAINGMSNALEVVSENTGTIRLATRNDLRRLNLNDSSSDSVSLQEDCIAFEPGRAVVSKMGANYLIVDGNHSLFSAPNRSEAETILRIVKGLGVNQNCFVGRPNASLTYVLRDQSRPSANLTDEDCIGFNTSRLATKVEGSSILLTDGSSRMFMFPNASEAAMALNVIRNHGFTKTCYVGRPDASFVYMK